MGTTNWNNIPPDLKKHIIRMGKDLHIMEFTNHQKKFKDCLFDIQYRKFRHIHVYLRFRSRTCPQFMQLH